MEIHLFGLRGCPDAREIREFLEANKVKFLYSELGGEDFADSHVPTKFRHHDLPVCVMPDGETLRRVNVKQVAERLNL